MREILFRGFTPDERCKTEIIVDGKSIKGQWVRGSYWELEKTTYFFKEDYEAHPDNTEHYIVFSEMTDWGLPNRQLKADVIPETVGQFTGLTDKNGKRIFEGDIVKHYHDKKFPESYSKGYIFWDEEYLRWKRTSENVNCCIANDCIYEVIGNIHDNPELLKGGDTK